MYHYVYLLTFQDGKKYVGMHSTTIKPELDTCYLGSGKYLPPRTPQTCSKQILAVFNTREEASAYEIELIDLHDCVKSPDWYNARRKTFDKHGTSLSEAHKQLISQTHKGRSKVEWGKKYSGAGRTPAQLAGSKVTSEKLRGTKCPAKGKAGVDNNGFTPWYYITPAGIYVEVLDITKQDYAAKLGLTPRQLAHRFHYTNEHKVGKTNPAKGWIFGNLPRPQDMEPE